MRRTRSRVPRGFTLLEVVVALAIGAMAILLAAMMLQTTARLTDYLEQRVRTVEQDRIGELRLRRLIGQMTWSQPTEPAPDFTSEGMRFTTWCDVPAGWQERCSAELRLAADAAPEGMVARLSTGEDLRLLEQRSPTGFLYLFRTERGATWVVRWTDRYSLPGAVGVVTRTDTLIIRIGDRG